MRINTLEAPRLPAAHHPSSTVSDTAAFCPPRMGRDVVKLPLNPSRHPFFVKLSIHLSRHPFHGWPHVIILYNVKAEKLL
jgi:hypothetical protein